MRKPSSWYTYFCFEQKQFSRKISVLHGEMGYRFFSTFSNNIRISFCSCVVQIEHYLVIEKFDKSVSRIIRNSSRVAGINSGILLKG